MGKVILSIYGGLLLFSIQSVAQETRVSGKVLDTHSNDPIPDVEIQVQGSSMGSWTDALGVFSLSTDQFQQGEQILVFSKNGYLSQRIPVIIHTDKSTELAPILLAVDLAAVESQIGVITLSDDQLDDDEGTSYNISGLLQASKDVFLNAAAFDFSTTFFRPRGYSSEDGKVLINGLEMNKLYDGRPQWSNWGGLNDVQRNQMFSIGLSSNEYNFGDLAGTTNIIMRASHYRKGGRISYALSNRVYKGRVMGSYNSGLLPSGWAYSLLVARRFAEEGFNEGTLYDANSFFMSVEKRFNFQHSLNLTAFYTPNRRGKSSANTQEVYDLKGTEYNSYWGMQDGEIRNSRIKKVDEPVIMLNHYWNITGGVFGGEGKTRLNTNVGYQFGKIGNSRLGYDNAPNPDPSYYQKLPSYFLANANGPNYEKAYKAQTTFVNDGQIDWQDIYETNIFYGGTSRYYLYEDRNDDKQLIANSILNSQINEHFFITTSLNYRNLNSKNFANMLDLLGGYGYLDIDTFSVGVEAQNDLNNPNRIVGEGDVFRYNFEFDVTDYGAFAQTQFYYPKVDFYLGAKGGKTTYQRNGLYKNGIYPNNSFGKSEKLDFTTYGIKAGFTYKLSGRHLFEANGTYYTDPPSLRNSFSNSRENNATVIGLTEEKTIQVDGSYIYRSPIVKLKLTGYYTLMQDASNISFFYADGISVQGADQVQTNGFIQEVLTDIDTKSLGAELGIQAQLTPTLKLKAAAAYGQNTYDNNPQLYIASNFRDKSIETFSYGYSYLKDYKVAGGPQQAYQMGFEYRDPEFWWFGATANYFSNAYINVSPLARTKNFYLDSDGMPFTNYDPEIARALLKQEKFDDYILVNLVGGKSWKIRDYYVGFFASVNNILDKTYKTGGYEQGRNANFKTMSKDIQYDPRVFGPKYWYGYGTTYYMNFYIRF